MADRAFGRLPRTFDPSIPHLSTLMAARAPMPPPEAVDWTTGMPADWRVMLNDRLGDCTCAGAYHAMQLWSFHGRSMILTEPDSMVEAMYEAVSAYQPGNPSTDNGAVEQDVMTYWFRSGVPIAEGSHGGQPGRSKLISFHEVDPRNLNDVKNVINWCGCVYIGFNVPAWMESGSDISAPWDDAGKDASSVGGHCVICPGYDAAGLVVVSWGQLYRMSWDFWRAHVDEAYCCVHPWWVDSTGKTPLGLTKADLIAQMAALS